MPKNIVRVLVWRPKHPYLRTPWASKGVFGYMGWGCLKGTVPKKIVCVVVWRPQHPYVCTPQASNGIFGYPGGGCLKGTVPKKLFRFGLAPQAPMVPYTMSQQRCFWIHGLEVFEMDNAKKHCLGPRVAPQTPIPPLRTPWARKGGFRYLGWGCLEGTMP